MAGLIPSAGGQRGGSDARTTQARQGSPLAERAVQQRLASSMGGGGGETVLVFILGSILVLLDGRGG